MHNDEDTTAPASPDQDAVPTQAVVGPGDTEATADGGPAAGEPAAEPAAVEPETGGVGAADASAVIAPTPQPGATAPTLGDVLVAVEELWPASLAEDWDAVGLVTGRLEQPIRRVVFAVDPTLAVVRDAVERGADLLITHHPLLLRGVKTVAADQFKGEVIHELIENHCALLTVHTNGDSAVGGVSDVLADIFGLTNVTPLVKAPEGLPEEGIGRVGTLPSALSLGDFASRVFGALPAVAGGVRVAGDRDGIVSTVAVCGGSGDSLFDAVCSARADVFVTADLRHHPASEAREAAVENRPYLIDISHFAGEWLWLPAAAEGLYNVLVDQGFAVEIGVSSINTDPWDFILTPGH
ncbi:Nif3-like dinuclear metal center hexameric protein [Arthrobacter sp.]|uniref:Nif3-like dinuclear metal center hexameric protein n=1 Tax=Arthrobacter sp. TaxID=1667 RepID=UPI003A8E4772